MYYGPPLDSGPWLPGDMLSKRARRSKAKRDSMRRKKADYQKAGGSLAWVNNQHDNHYTSRMASASAAAHRERMRKSWGILNPLKGALRFLTGR